MAVASVRVNNLVAIGPQIEVVCGISAEAAVAFARQNEPIPPAQHVIALIDTVASHSCIKAVIASRLQLNPVGQQKMSTPSSHNTICDRYFLRLTIPGMQHVYEGMFTEAPLEGQTIGCLIGRDILSQGVLVYNGSDNSFSFCL